MSRTEPPPGFSRADLHVHTTFSDGTATPEDVLNFYALRSHVRVFAITDHDTLDGALHARRFAHRHPELFGHLDVIVGEEVTTKQGHVLGLFLKEWIPPGLDAAHTVDEIHRQGGLAIAPHPYTNLMRWNGLLGVGDLIHDLDFDAIETRNSNFTEVFANRKAARHAGGKAVVGNSDGHFLDAVGLCYTEFPGSNAEDLRQALINRTSVAGGRCYGPITLLRFVIDRLRNGGSVMPQRQDFKREAVSGGLEIKVHNDSAWEAAVLTPCGRIDDVSVQQLKETLVLLTQAKVGVVLDMSQVEILTSSGITALVAGLKSARHNQVGFCLAALSAPCVRTLEAARLLRVVPRASTVVAATRLVISERGVRSLAA